MAKPDTPAGEHARNFGSLNSGQNALNQEMNTLGKHWVDSFQAQLNLTAELMSHLASARTLPEVMSACQECAEKRVALVSEESKQLMGDYQRWMTTAAKSLSGGFTPSASS
jgi:hypothetical protein